MGHSTHSDSAAAAGPGEGMSGSPRSPRVLRVALVAGTLLLPAWARRLVAGIRDSTFARIVVVVTRAPGSGRRESLLARARSAAPHLLHDLFLRTDARIVRCRPDAFALADASDLLRGCPRVEVVPEDEAGDARLRDMELDVALVLAPGVHPRGYAGIARHGAWSLPHASPLSEQESPAGFWEVLGAHRPTESSLHRWTVDAPRPTVIYSSFGTTDHVSVQRNRNQLFWKGSEYALRKLRDLALAGPASLEPVRDAAPADGPPRGKPRNFAMAGLAVRHTVRYFRKKLRDLRSREQWHIAYRFDDPAAPRETFEGLRTLVPPADRFWADPFPVRAEDGRYFLFFEELLFRDMKGYLVAAEVDPARGPGPIFKVLERDYHLSYPHVFRWEGHDYMVPETSATRKVTLYRCEAFPDRWTEERHLLEGIEAVDASVVEFGDRWWMFVNIAPYGAGNRDELHVYHAPSPLGPWTPHARNPVRSDCRAARPAGRLFVRDGQLFRPAQDCSRQYGDALVIHRVDRLEPDSYQETQVRRIGPDWDRAAIGTHTYNRCEGLLVIDVLRRRSRLR